MTHRAGDNTATAHAASDPARLQPTKLSAKESVKRMREFAKRRGQFIAAVRTDKSRNLPA